MAAKLEDGNVRAAIRLLVSAEAPAAPSEESLSKLREKHPPASGKADQLPAPQRDNCLMVEESEVRRAVLSFPAGSAGGPEAGHLRPQHIRDLVTCQESGHDFLTALTAFINLLLSGGCPSEVAPIFFGGRLLALNKKSGGVRPIAIGFSLRRLASKCANFYDANRLRSYFHPLQLGVGIPGGCEAAIHSARRYFEALPTDPVLVKLDFSNAFNSFHRSPSRHAPCKYTVDYRYQKSMPTAILHTVNRRSCFMVLTRYLQKRGHNRGPSRASLIL